MTVVFATVTFEGFHRWPDAPDEVAFLRTLHRHRFHVRLELPVKHTERDVEFILLQRRIARDVMQAQATLDVECWSCELWASYLLELYGAVRVEVSEDGENGAVVTA